MLLRPVAKTQWIREYHWQTRLTLAKMLIYAGFECAGYTIESMSDYHTSSLKEALKSLRQSPFVPGAAQYLANKASEINGELSATVLAEIPAFSESRNPNAQPDLATHGSEHTAQIVQLLSGGPVGEFEFVLKHARRASLGPNLGDMLSQELVLLDLS